MRKSALIVAATVAASFTLTNAEAAKKQAKPPADAAYEWNVKNVHYTAPNWGAPFQQPAEPAKAGRKSKKASKKA